MLILYVLAYIIRPYVSNAVTRRYFIPGFSVKLFGAVCVGLVYQFYYRGGDTFTYFHLGSAHIWNAFLDDPFIALSMIFGEMTIAPENFNYASKIYSYGDSASYAIVRLAGFFDIFTFHTYTATALLFASLSFVGIWMLYLTFYEHFPKHHFGLALSILFFPSLFFWGSGILKDSITISALGAMFYAVIKLLKGNKGIALYLSIISICFYTIYTIKIYILLCFLPALALLVFLQFQYLIRNMVVKLLIVPMLIISAIVSAYLAVLLVGEDHNRYALNSIAYTAEQTAKWNYYVSQRNDGSGYTLGDYDYSIAGLVKKFVPAVATSFFRPFLWEVRNIAMLFSALENFVVMVLFMLAVIRVRNWKLIYQEPLMVFCLVFGILFGFATGATTYNFGSLVRYKIPMIPFLVSAIFLLSRRRLVL